MEQESLYQMLPHGLLVTRQWLLGQGVSRHKVDNWVKSGALKSPAVGVLVQPSTTKLTWQAVVVSLQRMTKTSSVVVGGLTALEEQGYAHYLPQANEGSKRWIHLYSPEKQPAWMPRVTERHLPDVRFVWHRSDFPSGNEPGLYERDLMASRPSWGASEYPLIVSSPERAVFELLAEIPDRLSFEHADELLRGVPSLSPRRLAKLLDDCDSYKVRRLFLWFAERHQHPWLKHLDLRTYTMEGQKLGSGKRVIAKGGKLDHNYQITVPEDMYEHK